MSSPDPYARSWITAETLSLLRKDPWFGSLPKPLEEALLAVATPRRFSGGTQIFFRGDPSDGLYAVLEGSLRASGVTEAGKESILTIVEAPSWFGEVSLFDDMPRTHNVTTEGPTRLLHVPQADLLDLLEREPRYWRELGRLMALRLRLAFIGIEDMALLSAEIRLARRLLLLSQTSHASTGQSQCVVPISQAQLGMMLSLSRQTTNQVLQALQDQGIVHVAYGRIEVLALDKLIAVADLSGTEKRILGHLQSTSRTP
jgi:CRP/FNR family cyclic AMP-dependent transcriptional regulator